VVVTKKGFFACGVGVKLPLLKKFKIFRGSSLFPCDPPPKKIQKSGENFKTRKNIEKGPQ
jgi:hypothetical protein